MISSVVFDVGIFFLVNLAGAIEEEAIGHLHDVGLVENGDLFAMPTRGVTESVARDARAGGFAGDFQAGDDAGDDFVFDAAVEAFGVFADDDHVDAFVAGFDPAQAANRPHRGVKIQLLAKLHVDRFESLADRRGDRAFERDFVGGDGGERALRENIVHALLEGAGAGGHLNPLHGKLRRLEHPLGGAGDFRTDSIAGN